MSAQIQLFEFKSYRDYLRKQFSGTGFGRGKRSTLANYLNCQTSFLSQMLTDRVHLSMEHALKTSEFLRHALDEKNFFMLLVQKEKAGTIELQKYFQNQLNLILQKRTEIKERIKVDSKLSAEDQMKYYSVWYYSAIHILCALSKFNTLGLISEKLKLDIATVQEALSFLESRGFIESKGSTFNIGSRRIHLAKGSPMLPRHHSNWRMKAIEFVDKEKADDLHYSAILGIAKSDIPKFKAKILSLLEEFEPMIRSSKEEVPVALLMDWFEL